MRVMGIPIGFRLIMPKVIALALTMPLIVIWTDVMALLGGALSAQWILDMPPGFFPPQITGCGWLNELLDRSGQRRRVLAF